MKKQNKNNKMKPVLPKKQRTKKGFTIGEVMVAVFILTFGIISAVFLSARSIATITDSRDAIIASSLAQEGVELVRTVRDNSVTQSTCGSGSERCTAFDPNSGYNWPSLASGGGYCNVDYTLDASYSGLLCGAYDRKGLTISESDYTYSHDNAGVTTPFKRVIFIDYIDVQDGMPISVIPADGIDKVAAKITSVVTWENNPDLNIGSTAEAEANCKIGKQCAIAQTILTSWINFGE